MGNGLIIAFLVFSALSAICIVFSIVYLRKNKPAVSIAAAVVGALSGAEAIGMLFMFGFMIGILFVGYVVFIAYLNYKKIAKASPNIIENDSTNE